MTTEATDADVQHWKNFIDIVITNMREAFENDLHMYVFDKYHNSLTQTPRMCQTL